MCECKLDYRCSTNSAHVYTNSMLSESQGSLLTILSDFAPFSHLLGMCLLHTTVNKKRKGKTLLFSVYSFIREPHLLSIFNSIT